MFYAVNSNAQVTSHILYFTFTNRTNLQRHIYLMISSRTAITCIPRPIRFVVVYIKPNKQMRWWSGKKFSPKTFPLKPKSMHTFWCCLDSRMRERKRSNARKTVTKCESYNSYRLCYRQSNRKSFHEINYRRFDSFFFCCCCFTVNDRSGYFVEIRIRRSILSSNNVTQCILGA